MNLGQAVAVCLHELVREANAPLQAEKQPAATGAELERLTAMLLDALHASGYVKPTIASPTEEKIRRLVRRLGWKLGSEAELESSSTSAGFCAPPQKAPLTPDYARLALPSSVY